MREGVLMGLRFRKSIKIAPGVKLNLNKKSTSVTFGGKGVHHTISSTGKRTSTVGIPGTGLSYSKTSGTNKTQHIHEKENSNALDNENYLSNGSGPHNNSADGKPPKKPFGCLSFFLAIIGVLLIIGLFPLIWFPGIVAIVWFALKPSEPSIKKKRVIISSVITISSFLYMVFMPSDLELTGVRADWEEYTYDISDTAEVKIVPIPSEADIEDLEISDKSIAELKYKNGKAILSFKKTGDAQIFFTANDDKKSNAVKIIITDKEAEKKAEEERIKAEQEEAAKIAEEERIKAEQEEAARIAEEERIKAEQEAAVKAEAERLAAEQEAATKANSEAPATQQSDPIVYITNTGKKYHTGSCRTLKDSKIEKHLSEVKGSYGPCGICNPPM